ncbi:MAG: cation-transporting P-type ATPase [Ruminococcaceae bacterium]|nr:cation-transporting P-type ATPase [Oscillospiraceae bacterium]
MTDNWYSLTISQIEEKLNTDISSGLSNKAANTRRNLNGANLIYREKQKGLFEQIKDVFTTDYINLLFIIVVIIAAIFDRDASYLYMVLIMAVSRFIVVSVYVKAKNVLEGMGHLSLPFSRVMREGKLFVVRQENLVRGDIIFISQGDIVPCDARLVESDRLCILETNLFDVKAISQKDAKFAEHKGIGPENQKNMIFASTVVTRGSGKAIVCEIGMDTCVYRSNKNISVKIDEKIGVLETFKKYCTGMSLCLIALIFILTFTDLILATRGIGLFNTFLTGLALAVSTMSEQLVIFGYMMVGCGIFSAIHRTKKISSGALIKNASKIEKIKDISCLLVHREGVLSLKKIQVERVFSNGNIYQVNDKRFAENCKRIVRYAVISSGRYGTGLISSTDSNIPVYPDDEAIVEIADRYGIYNVSLDRQYPIIDHIHRSAENVFDTTLTSHGGKYIVTLKGNCKQVLDRCSYYRQDNSVVPLTPEIADSIAISAFALRDEAYRIIGVASKNFAFNTLDRIRSAQNELVFEGFLAIREPILFGAAKQISRCKAAGIKVMVLSDDINMSNFSFAKVMGILDEENQVLTGAQMYKLGENELKEKVKDMRLFQNLSTAQKRLLVKTLKDNGEVVGVLGSDLEEIALEKDADVAFSKNLIISDKEGRMGVDVTSRNLAGKGSCDALKFISDVIVSEASEDGTGGFNGLVGAIESSKVIYQNILRTVRYLAISQFAKFFAVLYTVLSGNPYFTPIQIITCGLLVDLAAVTVIAFEKPSLDELSVKINTEETLKKPIQNYWYTILTGLLWIVIMLAVPYVLGYLGLPIVVGEFGTYMFFSFILTQLITLNEVMKERSIFVMNIKLNRVYVFVLFCIILFVVLCSELNAFASVFGTVQLSMQGWVCTFLVPVIMMFIYELSKIFTRNKRK